MLTNWTFCAPFHFVKQFTEKYGDRGEVDAFYRSWCWYDWPLAYAMVEGSGKPGYYKRPRTLSRGDDVCDMCWAAEPPAEILNRIITPIELEISSQHLGKGQT